jgi:hypothetical protein
VQAPRFVTLRNSHPRNGESGLRRRRYLLRLYVQPEQLHLSDHLQQPSRESGHHGLAESNGGKRGGDALQFNYTYPSPNLGSTTLTALINNGWNYTPSSQGAVGGINFSLDKKVVTDFTIGSITGPAIIEQGGNFYIDFISGLPIGGVYQTITGTDLQASDFGLYDFSTGTFNAAINPNFSATGAEIFFGVANRQNSGIVLGPAMTNVFFDNVSWNIVSAPEPGEWMLLAAGLFGVALMSKKLRHA